MRKDQLQSPKHLPPAATGSSRPWPSGCVFGSTTAVPAVPVARGYGTRYRTTNWLPVEPVGPGAPSGRESTMRTTSPQMSKCRWGPAERPEPGTRPRPAGPEPEVVPEGVSSLSRPTGTSGRLRDGRSPAPATAATEVPAGGSFWES